MSLATIHFGSLACGEAAKNEGVVKLGESSLGSLTPFLVTLCTATAKLDKLAADTVTKEHVAEAETLAVQTEAHFDGSKRVMAKCKAILDEKPGIIVNWSTLL